MTSQHSDPSNAAVPRHETRPIRLVVCDPHIAFAESLAHTLQASGTRVMAIVQKLPEALAALVRHPADICVVGLGGVALEETAIARLRELATRTSVVILVDTISPEIRSRCIEAGVQGLTEMRRGIADVVRVLENVHSGRRALGSVGTPLRGRPKQDGTAHRLAGFLSAREREVLSALVLGDHTAAIARSMGISSTTARGHIQGVLTKLGAHSRIEAVTIAVRERLVDPHTGDWLAS